MLRKTCSRNTTQANAFVAKSVCTNTQPLLTALQVAPNCDGALPHMRHTFSVPYAGLLELQMHLPSITSFLHSQLRQHGADAAELWTDSDAMHIVMRTTHQAGKMRLLALLSILSVHVHKASMVILFPSTEAQHQFRQHVDTACAQAEQALAVPMLPKLLASACDQTPAHTDTTMTGAVMLHEQHTTLDCGTPITVIRSQTSQLSAASPADNAALHDLQHLHPDKSPQRYMLCIVDHDLCTSDKQLLNFWTHLQQQQQHAHGLEQTAHGASSEAVLLSKPFDHLGSLWRIVSMTHSMPGLASTLTGSKEPGFRTHLVQTQLPQGCTAHPMMMPEEEREMSGIQRRITPLSAAVTVQQAQLRNQGLMPWYASHPSLLQWVSILTEEGASRPNSADPKLMLVVGATHPTLVDQIIDHAEASSLSLTVLELADSTQGTGILTASSDCFARVADALDSTLLAAADTKDQHLSGSRRQAPPAKLMLPKQASPADPVSAMCSASASAAAAQGKPIHGIVLLSGETLQRLQAIQPSHAVTDLYLCDLGEAGSPDSTAPLSQMAACTLHAVTAHLCGVFPR